MSSVTPKPSPVHEAWISKAFDDPARHEQGGGVAAVARVAHALPRVMPAVGATSRTPRVVFVNRFYHPDISATSQILTDLTRRLATLGFDTHVVCSRQLYEQPCDPLPAEESIEGVSVHRVWTTRFGRAHLPARAVDYLSFYPAAVQAVSRLVGAGDVVVAKTDPPLLSVVVGPVARLRAARVVNWMQDVFPEIAGRVPSGGLPAALVPALMRLRDRSLRRASMNVVLGAGMRDYLRGRDVPDARLRVVANWAIGEPVLQMPASASRLRGELGLDGRFVVGYSGNLGLVHDSATILGAAEHLRSDPDIVFLMIGGGSGMRGLETSARARGLANIRFLPYQPRELLVDSLAAADAHLVSLLPEAEGLVVPSKLYGVMAVGRPVVFIGDTRGEVAHAIERARCGAAVPSGDVRGLVAQLQALRADGELRLRLGRNAAEAYQSNYTFEAATRRWVDLLQGVMA
jgi:glycosyltransferase involved in cell wall biosynthesis